MNPVNTLDPEDLPYPTRDTCPDCPEELLEQAQDWWIRDHGLPPTGADE